MIDQWPAPTKENPKGIVRIRWTERHYTTTRNHRLWTYSSIQLHNSKSSMVVVYQAARPEREPAMAQSERPDAYRDSIIASLDSLCRDFAAIENKAKLNRDTTLDMIRNKVAQLCGSTSFTAAMESSATVAVDACKSTDSSTQRAGMIMLEFFWPNDRPALAEAILIVLNHSDDEQSRRHALECRARNRL
jgi:hypothetical protein